MSEQFEQDEREALTNVLNESLIDIDTGPLSDTPYVQAEVEDDGMLGLYLSDDPGAWPDAAIDIPQLVNTIQAAGFRRSPAPQQVSTVEELDTLPIRTVVRAADGDVLESRWVKFSDQSTGIRWNRPGWEGVFSGIDIALPATVLYRPEGGESA